jgi:hypothetical protein
MLDIGSETKVLKNSTFNQAVTLSHMFRKSYQQSGKKWEEMVQSGEKVLFLPSNPR